MNSVIDRKLSTQPSPHRFENPAAGHPADAQAKEMYSWTDENGVVHFSDIKPEGQEAQSRVIPQGQAELDRLEPHRRVFFTNEKGETERVDDVERANKVAQLKAQIAKNCKLP